jgi:ferredoxin hydrogenase large subunit/hydrogenase large subunit
MTIVKIDPLTRIEGHLKIETVMDTNTDSKFKEKFRVREARSTGLMFRGVEVLLQGRDPMDAQHIVQRICGVCPIAHGIASCMAQEVAYRTEATANGRLIQNLILVSDYIHSCFTHFYLLAALDFVNVKAILEYKGNDPKISGLKQWAQQELKDNRISPVAPFLPRYEGDYIENVDVNISLLAHYVQAFDMRALAYKMGCVFGGKMPHTMSLLPTGANVNVRVDDILSAKTKLEELITFINQVYLPDVALLAKSYPQYFKIGKGPEAFLCAGVFRESNYDMYIKPGVVINGALEEFNQEMITEDVRFSYYSSRSKMHPFESETKADPYKQGAYSWLKAPRYKRKAMQVGPAARLLVQYARKNNHEMCQLSDKLLEEIGGKPGDLNSAMGRHLARAVECKFIAERAMQWLDQLNPKEPSAKDFDLPETGIGYGCLEAPRGTLGHWLKIKNYVIENYQCVVPTTWNCSPRDDDGQPSAVEQSLEGTLVADAENPIEVGRVVRSFDPCIACSVH